MGPLVGFRVHSIARVPSHSPSKELDKEMPGKERRKIYCFQLHVAGIQYSTHILRVK